MNNPTDETMKTNSVHPRVAMMAFAAAVLAPSARAGDGVLDLSQLANYANQTKPAYITKDNTTAGNPITNAGATLGRVLFHDRRLSRNDAVSCSTCHVQSHAFGDSAVASTGVNGTTGRHSMRLINSRFANERRFFWDERAATLEAQTTQPVRDHVEMGFSGTSGDPDFATLTAKLAAISEYRVLFSMTFGDSTVSEARIQSALAQFVRSIQSFDSKFDAGRAQVANNNATFPNFTAQENNGKALFLNAPGPGGGAGCNACHAAPEFDIDPNSLNNGVITRIGGGTDLTNTRSPSLRDLIGPGGQSNGPFMHDGGFSTLAQVINHYNAIPGDNTNLDPRLRRPGGGVQNLNLTQQQRNDLAAFLLTLTGSNVYTDEKWSDPFDAQNQLTLIVLPPDAVTITDHGNGTATIACQAAPNLPYKLQSSSDLKQWTHVETLTSSATGRCEKLVGISGTQFYRFTYEPPM
jgi:cytochrome c peroxidase